jgi:hypothetical protein
MSAPQLDRILLEASPGEVRAVALANGVPWDIAIERTSAAARAGDIYMARAGAEGPNGSRFFDIGEDEQALIRKPRNAWTNGAYGLVQVLRGEAGDKGPRVTDRVWLDGAWLSLGQGATGPAEDRIEAPRSFPKARRSALRAMLARDLPPGVAIRLHADPGEGPDGQRYLIGERDKLVAELSAMTAGDARTKRLARAAGDVAQLIGRAQAARIVPADPASAAWATNLLDHKSRLDAPDLEVAAAIDAAIAEALSPDAEILDGARVWVEPTHAIVAVDVDVAQSGADAAAINDAAADEIARRLRVARLGGLIVVDFLRRAPVRASLRRMAELGAADPWPWTPPEKPDTLGLTSFARPRMGASLSELAFGGNASALAALRLACRKAASGANPASLAAPPAIIGLLQGALSGALEEAAQRIGQPLDLKRDQALRSPQIFDAAGKRLD